jgi:hypothetical protein
LNLQTSCTRVDAEDKNLIQMTQLYKYEIFYNLRLP